MTPDTYNFPDHYEGDNWGPWTITITDDDTETPIDITGAVITMTLRRIGSTGAVIDTKTVANGLTLTDAANGEFEIDEYVVDYDHGWYKYDITVSISGKPVTYLAGTWKIIKKIAA